MWHCHRVKQTNFKTKGYDMKKYMIRNLLKTSEEDIYDEGCQPNTCAMSNVDISFRDSNLKLLLDRVSDCIGAAEYQVNPCEDDSSRVEWQTLEDSNGFPASKIMLAMWKQSRIKLWACTYTAYVEVVETCNVQEVLDENV